MKKIVIFSMIALIAMTAMPAMAAETAVGESYFMPEAQAIEGNFYVAGGMVDLSGPVNGDLVAAGGNLLMTGDVSGDVLVGGGTVELWGKIGGDVRLVGGQVRIGEDVGGEILAAGGFVQVRPNVTVNGDVIIAAGSPILAGNYKGKVLAAGGDVVLAGAFEKDVVVYFDESFTITENTTIAGNLVYHGREPIEIPSSAVIAGDVIFEKFEEKAPEMPGLAPRPDKEAKGVIALGVFMMMLLKALITFIAALVGISAWRKFSAELVEHSVKNFGIDLLRGFLVAILGPVLVLILFLTVLGAFFGGFAALLYGMMWLIAMVYAGVLLGAMIFKLFTRSKEYPVTWLSALVGILLLHLIGLIPIIGWLFCAVFILTVWGSVACMGYYRFWVKRQVK